MSNTSYIGISRMTALARQMDVVANNIANINTSGYKGEQLLFTQYLQNYKNGEKVAFVNDITTYRDFTPGDMQKTGNPMDVAIQGDGFLAVDTPDGERYTRNGGFSVGIEGELITAQGYPVLDESRRPIILPEGFTEFEVRDSGSVVVDGREVGTIGVVNFANLQNLEKTKDGLFKSSLAQPKMEKPEATVFKQGVVEGSNVNGISEMARLIEIHRNFESTSRFLERENDRVRRAIQKIADVMG